MIDKDAALKVALKKLIKEEEDGIEAYQKLLAEHENELDEEEIEEMQSIIEDEQEHADFLSALLESLEG